MVVTFDRGADVFPARAGMIRCLWSLRGPVASIPRESGDDPSVVMAVSTYVEYSPRERG